MMNITKLYQQLNEGKIQKSFFVKEARRQFPQYISPVSSFDDIVKILKGKRVISESTQFENESKPTFSVGDTVIPKIGPHKGTNHKIIHDNGDGSYNIKPIGVDPKHIKYRLGAVRASGDSLELSQNLSPVKADDTPADPDLAGQGYNVTEEEVLNESHKLTPEQILDRLSPYAVKKGIEVELAKEKTFDSGTLDKVKARVARKLKKNPNAYSEEIVANSKEIKKVDQQIEPKELKQELVDKKNAMKKPKGFKAEKANTKTSKKENKKGKPKGVKVMPDKGVTGSEKVIKESVFDEDEKYFDDLEQAKAKAKAISAAEGVVQHVNELPQGGYVVDDWYDYETTVVSYGRGEMLEQEKQSVLGELYSHLKEHVGHNYHVGQDVHTPEGQGTIKNIIGGTLTIELGDGTLKDFQMNIVDKATRDAHFASMKGFGSTLQNSVEEDTASHYGKINQGERDEIKKEIPDAEFEETDEEDRMYTDVTSDSSTEDKIRKIIEKILKSKKFNEAKKFKAGGETVFKSDKEATEYEQDLKKAGVKYTKSNV